MCPRKSVSKHELRSIWSLQRQCGGHTFRLTKIIRQGEDFQGKRQPWPKFKVIDKAVELQYQGSLQLTKNAGRRNEDIKTTMLDRLSRHLRNHIFICRTSAKDVL